MNLHELVKQKCDLLTLADRLSTTHEVQTKIRNVEKFLSKNSNSTYVTGLHSCTTLYESMLSENQQALSVISGIIDTINVDIDAYVEKNFNNDEYRRIFSEEMITQELVVDESTLTAVTARISEHSIWKFPGLQINPRKKLWVDCMVSSDPLYLIGPDKEIINDILQTYPIQYQRRVRTYFTHNRDFSKLPQEQFGFVLCWDNFNYLSIEKIRMYLKRTFSLLRPGGVFMFSYNNSDLEGGALRANAQASSYCSFGMLSALAKELGYEILYNEDIPTEDKFNPYVSWIELKRPGELKTVKQHQAMAEIIGG